MDAAARRSGAQCAVMFNPRSRRAGSTLGRRKRKSTSTSP